MAEIRYCLLESAAGYALFQRKEGDEIASKLKELRVSPCLVSPRLFLLRTRSALSARRGVCGARRVARGSRAHRSRL